MTTSTDLILTDSPRARDVTSEQYALIQIVGAALHASRYYASISNPERAAYLMARAYELGFPATAAPDVIDDIQGRLTLKPQAAWALVLRSGLLARIEVEEGDDYCEIRLTRKDNGITQGYKFTRSDAQKADLIKVGGAYEKWAKNMYYWRAMGFAIDRAFPDVTVGLKDSPQFGGTIPTVHVDVTTGELIEVAP